MILSASIVAYRNDELQLSNAMNGFLNTDDDVILYLIDNSPTDELKRICVDKRIKYFHNPSNPGFGAAHNIAFNYSLKNETNYHIVLNPDVIFTSESIQRMIQFMETDQKIGNLMPKVLYPDNSIQHLCKLLPTPYDWIGRRFNPFRKLVEKRNQLFELHFTEYNKIMEVPYLSGCFMFLRVDALKKVGLFDENIFMYGEETDLCRRLITGGYKTVFYPEVSIIHEFQKGSHKSWRLTWIGIQSAIYYFNKWGWFFDKERTRINKETLQKLGYKK